MPTKPELIIFLCPNGHRLNGPASLAGKAGQCPHCGAKFRVPSPDDPPDDDSAELSPEELGTGSSGVGSGSMNPLDQIEEIGSDPRMNFNYEQAERGSSASRMAGVSPSSLGSERHAMCDLFLRLWGERERGSVLELHLLNGDKLVVEQFSREQSRPRAGLFAGKDADGSFTVSAVAWENIARITLRHLAKPPKKLFD